MASFAANSSSSASDLDVFSRLSRLIETSEYKDRDKELEDLCGQIASPILNSREDGKQRRAKATNADGGGGDGGGAGAMLPDRKTPYQVWKEKQATGHAAGGAGAQTEKTKQAIKLTNQQMDRMISKMHRVNRSKQDEVVRVQNEGLRQELGGYEFKPRINPLSSQKAKGMPKLIKRMPALLKDEEARHAKYDSERKAAGLQRDDGGEIFVPQREGKAMSDKYLKKMGRTARVRPEDFFNYQREKERRNEQRKQIVDEIEARSLVFTPTLPRNTVRLHQQLAHKNSLEFDPITRTTTLNRPKEDNEDVMEGPTLLLESEHPYRNNLNEHTVISVPGAISYSISFREGTQTEPVHDYVRFLSFDNYDNVLGCGKYTGGAADKDGHPTPSNWCGMGGRPPLVITAAKFVVHFHTNMTVTDFGFQMEIAPTVNTRLALAAADKALTFQPEISARGASHVGYNTASGTVHDRLFADAQQGQRARHNAVAAKMADKLNVSLRVRRSFFLSLSLSFFSIASICLALSPLALALALAPRLVEMPTQLSPIPPFSPPHPALRIPLTSLPPCPSRPAAMGDDPHAQRWLRALGRPEVAPRRVAARRQQAGAPLRKGPARSAHLHAR